MLGTQNGLMEFDGQNWIVYNYNWITGIGIDHLGNRWFGGRSVLKYNEQTWNTFNSSNSGIPDYNYRTILTDQYGVIWFANYSQGLIKYNGQVWSIYNTSNSGLPSNYVSSIAPDEQGDLWIGTSQGLVKYDGHTTWKVYNSFNSSLPGNSITSLAIDIQNTLWLGTDANGLVKFDGETWTVYNTSNSDIPTNTLSFIRIDENDNKWIGSGSGLIKFNGQTWSVFNTSNSPIPDNGISSIAIDSVGNIWIGTSYGAAVYREEGVVLTAVKSNKTTSVDGYSLLQNYPNPFNPTTTISYQIPKTGLVSLKVYDVLGREVAILVNEEKTFGKYKVEFNGSKLSSGIYLYRIQAGNYSSVKKMVLIK